MERNTRSMNPPMNHKPRNGPISPRERDMNNSSYSNSNHQPHYNYNNSSQNHSSMSPNQQNQPQQLNSDLINFVQGAWKEKMNAEIFKPETTSEKPTTSDYFDGWLRTRQH